VQELNLDIMDDDGSVQANDAVDDKPLENGVENGFASEEKQRKLVTP
jgi:hypothetical protein